LGLRQLLAGAPSGSHPLDGILEIRFDESLLVGPKDAFDIFEYNGLVFGEFSDIVSNARSFGFVATDFQLSSTGSLQFNTSAVPEPSALLLIVGASLLAAGSRRRW
jgi:hypothetical protein